MINSKSGHATSFSPQLLGSGTSGRRRLTGASTIVGGVALLAGLSGCGAPPNQPDQGLVSISPSLTASKFKGWSPVGIFSASFPYNFSSGAAAAMRATNGIDLIARGSDNAFYYAFGFTTDNWVTPHWGSAYSLGGVLLGRPSVSTYGVAAQYFIVAGRGTNNQAYVIATAPALNDAEVGWTPWVQVSNGALSNEPAVTFANPYIYVFGNGTDNKVYWSRNDVSGGYDSNNWQAWTGPIPNGVLTSEPAVASLGGTLYLVGRGTTNFYYFTRSTDGGTTWSPWILVDPSHTFTKGPALSVSPNGQLNVFGVLSNGRMYGLTSNDGGDIWGEAADAGGNLLASAGAVSSANGVIHTFALGTDNQIYWDLYRE